jgi:hypothetical protein
MEPRNEILVELKTISPVVAGIGSLNPYQLPEEYFETFAEQVMKRIRAASISAKEELENLSPLLNSLSKQLPFDLPENYFQDLSEQALVGVKAIEFVNEELENLSPLMSSLKSKPVYKVPFGYFSNLPEKILNKAKNQGGKLIPINPVKRLMKYAVAAIVAGVIAMGSWFMFNRAVIDQPTVKVENSLHQASDEEILNFIQSDASPVTETALNTNGEMNQADMKMMLANVPDEELEQFAKQTLN